MVPSGAFPSGAFPSGAFRSSALRAAVLLGALLAVAARPGAVAAQERSFGDLPWQEGPATGDLGDEAQIRVPEGCLFTAADGARQFMELTENPTSGTERGVLVCDSRTSPAAEPERWWVVFSFDPSGYVKDDEKDELDADAILASIKRGSEEANEERAQRGWGRFDVVGWMQKPFYDPRTNNLTWSIDGKDETDDHTINHSVRLLGRGGVMHVDLVTDPAQLATAVPEFNAAVAGFTFKPGHRYSEWRDGDKLAGYGLTALVAGGAGAAAAKSGLLGKLWKVIVAGLIGLGAGIKKLFGRKDEQAA